MMHWSIVNIFGVLLAVIAIAMLTMAAMKQKDRE
jgi:hypothetical protein